MSLFQRHRWFAAAAGITLAFAGVSAVAHASAGLAGFADVVGLALMLATAGIALANGLNRPPRERGFWALLTFGFSLWATTQSAWTYYDIALHRQIPDPSFFDIILFFHAVPIIAAVAWRPDILKKEGRIHLSLLNFLMLLGWWIFLYAFIVFPHQYVVANVTRYNIYYDDLYLLQSALLLGVLGLAAWTSTSGWRRLYLHFLAADLIYAVGSQFLDRAVSSGAYYSGSLYDIPLIGTVAWLAAAALSAREWDLQSREFSLARRWKKVVPQLAMLALLSLPVLGVWTVLMDKSPDPSRVFRVFAVLTAMLVLGSFVFLRQYSQDQALMALLQESRRGYESQKRLQNQLVQKEKLASLGNLVAGAAHEINHPLAAIMSYSEQLWAKERISDEQDRLVRKIVNQAQRTRDLVADLLSFAQQSPGEKTLVDLSVLLQRATQMLESRYAAGKIRVTTSVAADFPRVHGNANQLFQAFIEIIENAIDALQESGGGTLEIAAQRLGSEAVLHHQARGQRNRPRPERGLRSHPGAQRPDQLPEQARRRGALYCEIPRGAGTGGAGGGSFRRLTDPSPVVVQFGQDSYQGFA